MTIENLPTALAHKGIEYFVTKMNNSRVDKKSTSAIIQTDEIKTMEKMDSQLQNMLCMVDENLPNKNKSQRNSGQGSPH
jgi:lantibiotic modifying enzyme